MTQLRTAWIGRLGAGDVPVTMVSLQRGAERYLGQRYGLDSLELTQFLQKGTDHGITAELTP